MRYLLGNFIEKIEVREITLEDIIVSAEDFKSSKMKFNRELGLFKILAPHSS